MPSNIKNQQIMATFKDGYMGAFNGKLGPAIGYMWKGRPCLRSHQAFVKDPRTRNQLRSRSAFSTVSALAADMRSAIEIGLRGLATERGCSVGNTFISLNHRCVAANDGTAVIDYTSVQVAGGGLEGVDFGTLEVEEPSLARVGFTTAAGSAADSDDYVYLYAYLPSLNHGLLSLPAARAAGSVSLRLPQQWCGRETHFYGFCWDHDLQCSPSTYLGQLVF